VKTKMGGRRACPILRAFKMGERIKVETTEKRQRALGWFWGDGRISMEGALKFSWKRNYYLKGTLEGETSKGSGTSEHLNLRIGRGAMGGNESRKGYIIQPSCIRRRCANVDEECLNKALGGGD